MSGLCVSSSSESELPEVGHRITSRRPHLLHAVPWPVLPVSAAASVKRTAPGALNQRACHCLKIDLVTEPNVSSLF